MKYFQGKLKYVTIPVLILLFALLLPLLPLIAGSFIAFKLMKLNYGKLKKYGVIAVVVLFTFFIQSKWAEALPSSSQPTTNNIEKTSTPASEPASQDIQAEVKPETENITEVEEVPKESTKPPVSPVISNPTPAKTEESKKGTSQGVSPQSTSTTNTASGSSYSCAIEKTCGEMSSCEEAYYHLNTCGFSKRDADNDGVPCESICN